MLVENYTIIFMMHKQIKQHQGLALLDFLSNLSLYIKSSCLCGSLQAVCVMHLKGSAAFN